MIFKFFIEAVVLTTLTVFLGYLAVSAFLFICLQRDDESHNWFAAIFIKHQYCIIKFALKDDLFYLRKESNTQTQDAIAP